MKKSAGRPDKLLLLILDPFVKINTMRSYYLTYILATETAGEEKDKIAAKIKKLVEEAGGKIVKADEWGKRQLAYPIKKQTEGFFINMNLEFEGKEAKPIDEKLRLEERILRHLLVRKE